MRRGRLCAFWILVAACSPGGDAGTSSVVAPSKFDPATPGQGGTGGGDVVPGFVDDGEIFGGADLACTNGCAFGPDPILDAGVSAAEITPFTASPDFQAGSLCVVEPQLSSGDRPGALFPRNWLRPRFRWTSTGGETLWEIRMHAESQPDDLRAYTRNTQWLVPNEVWRKMRSITKPVTVTIRGLGAGGAITGSQGNFEIAPVDAGGSLVFWATTSSLVDYAQASSKLQGFSLGDEAKGTDTDEAVGETLTASEVKTGNIPSEGGDQPRGFYACGGATPRPTCTAEPNNPACCNPTGFEYGAVECVGCHVSTPDGKAVLFTDNWPWDKVAASIEPATVGELPTTITPYASRLLKQPWLGMQALSPAYFAKDGEVGPRFLVTSYGQRPAGAQPYDATPPTRHELAWFDLNANDALYPIPEEIPPDPQLPGQTVNIYQVRDQRNSEVARARNVSYGLIATIGETRSAVTPAWSNDGQTLAYVSTDISSTDGHPDWTANAADIHVVPYNDHAGGTMTPLAGASAADALEYYPDFSADDAFVAFARAPIPSTAPAIRCVPRQDASGVVTPCAATNLGENPDGPYYNRNGEIYIVPRAGAATPTRLIANDPVSCTGETARGSINSWPKWSPRVAKADGKTYYFLMFSSGRSYDATLLNLPRPANPGSYDLPKARLTPAISPKSSQLYMAAIVVDDASGAVTTYPAVYLWNQNITVGANGEALIENTSNLTPAWDDFSIPPVPVPINVPR